MPRSAMACTISDSLGLVLLCGLLAGGNLLVEERYHLGVIERHRPLWGLLSVLKVADHHAHNVHPVLHGGGGANRLYINQK